MMNTAKRTFSPYYVLTILFLLVFAYLKIFNQHHLFYLEQTQLFRYSWTYFNGFLVRPGGFSQYLGAFFTQFFVIPSAGPALLTLLLILFPALLSALLKKFSLSGLIWPLLPVMLILVLHNDYLFKPEITVSFLLSLAFTLGCLFIPNSTVRGGIGIAGFVLMYQLAGITALLIPVILLLHELFISRSKYAYLNIGGYLVSILLVPYLSWKLLYLLPFSSSLLSPFPILAKGESKFTLFLLLGYVPGIIILLRSYALQVKREQITFPWNWKNTAAGFLLVALLAGFVIRSYDSNTEKLMKIDYDLQQANWDKALQECTKYPEPNTMVNYFTNLALLESGKIGDQMFHYPQLGPQCLSLPWSNNNIVPFFGCDIYYHIGYINEAFRWAFEAMEINGPCPRLVKRLVMTSLINGDHQLAEKYLKLLKESLFYHKWADSWLSKLDHPDLLNLDSEIKQKRNLLVEKDFFVGANQTPLCLHKLLENHPDNKIAFEYYMAELLLEKDMVTFVNNLGHLRELGYRSIPVHYEEVILWYIGYSKQNVIPQGYNIRKSTLEQFKNYLYAYSRNDAANSKAAILKKDFGNTYWYYYHFINQPNVTR